MSLSQKQRSDVRAAEVEMEQAVHKRLAEGDYAYWFGQIECEYRNGVLTLTGSVPSFYLKQLIQERLRDVRGVERIDNQVNVVNAYGLSSVRPR
jgi:osmotically-inducible protein OsmY